MLKNVAEGRGTISLCEPPSNNYAKKRQRRRDRKAKLRRKQNEKVARGFAYTIVPGTLQPLVHTHMKYPPMRVTNEDSGSATMQLVTSICFCCVCILLVVYLFLVWR